MPQANTIENEGKLCVWKLHPYAEISFSLLLSSFHMFTQSGAVRQEVVLRDIPNAFEGGNSGSTGPQVVIEWVSQAWR